MEKFYKGYLESDYASFFLGHENGTIYLEERIVRLSYQVPQEKGEIILPTQSEIAPITISTPQQARNHFVKNKLSFLESR